MSVIFCGRIRQWNDEKPGGLVGDDVEVELFSG
jgi:hypothetical protein